MLRKYQVMMSSENKSKKVIAYVNTKRIHWLVEELQRKNISEIMVTEFFRINSQISKLEFYCDENDLDELCALIHKIGTSGKSADHLLFVKEVEGNPRSIFPFV